jgi:FkbM family methyltransferase
VIPALYKLLYAPLTWGLPQGFAEFYARIVRQLLLRTKKRTPVALPYGFSLRLNGQDFIQRHLLFYGVWEPTVSSWIYNSLNENDVFCDVGANIGYYSLLASRKVGREGAILALEASPSIHSELQQNTAPFKNVTCTNIAVGNQAGRTPIYKNVAENSGLSSIFKDGTDSSLQLEAEVPMKTLDHILEEAGNLKPRLIKIDVEGAEWLVLEGMKKTLAALNEDLEIIVEFDAPRLKQFSISPEQFFEWFKSKGFMPYDLNNHYKAKEYFPNSPIPAPTPIHDLPQVQTDLLFSRASPTSIAQRHAEQSVREFIHHASTNLP